MPDLSKKTAIVTGASRGIGKATALELARSGANVVLAARSRDALTDACKELETLGAKTWACACDVADYAQVESLVVGAQDHFGSLDILINNAGVIEPIARLEDAKPESWAQIININLVGVFHAARAVLPHFFQQGRGVIINVSSGAAYQPLEGWSAYCASKAAVAMLTRSLALEAGPKGVTVYGLQPGVVDTQMQGTIRASGINPISQLPRASLTDPQVPAKVMAWLCSPEAADLAGQDLSIRDEALRRRAGLEPA